MGKYSKIEDALADLENHFSGTLIRWTDKEGKHTGNWRKFLHFAFTYFGLDGKLDPKDCPLLEFDMDQLNALNDAQQLAALSILDGLGFPALERTEEGHLTGKSGIVRLEDMT